VNAEAIATEITDSAAALEGEVTTLAKSFKESRFFGDNRNFPHAHYGYIMACMGQIDLMSLCRYDATAGKQTPRMKKFMQQYLGSQKTDEHRVAIQLMRHTLMHTGALRYLYDPNTKIGYTWRIYFGSLPGGIGHYTLTPEDAAYQSDLTAAVGVPVAGVQALNVELTTLASDIRRVAVAYTTEMKADAALRSRCESVYANIRVQTLR
jgi:hypothetical protein